MKLFQFTVFMLSWNNWHTVAAFYKPARDFLVKAFASQSVDPGFDFLVDSDQKT